MPATGRTGGDPDPFISTSVRPRPSFVLRRHYSDETKNTDLESGEFNVVHAFVS